ncbi:MAG: GNAT family N-acetyltransferase, partial [Pseudomonadota bacterium]
MRVRAATTDDINTITTFNVMMAKETENKVLDVTTLTKGVTAILNDPSKGRYWLAENDHDVVGQIMVTWEWSDWRNGYFWWIQSVYVATNARRGGVFSLMLTEVIDAAKASGDAVGVRLYVEKDNIAAIKTYDRAGFEDPNYRLLELTITN